MKINSATHKLEWNYLYRLVTPNSKGQPKCDVDIYKMQVCTGGMCNGVKRFGAMYMIHSLCSYNP